MFYFLRADTCSSARRIGTAAVVAVANLLATVPAHTAGGHWTMTAVEGVTMVVVGDGEGAPAQRGHPLTAGTTLVTGPDGTVTLMRRGDSITVYPNSEVKIPNAANGNYLGVIQRFGKLLYRMETRESWNFEVRTPFLAATVKGTVFIVKVTHDRATVTVTEGMVHIAPARGGRSNVVRAGSRGTVSAGGVHEVSVENVDPEKSSFWKIGRIRGKPLRTSGDRSSSRGNAARGDPSRSDSQGGDSQGGDSQGGDSQGGDSQGGDSQGGNNQGDNSSGNQQ